MPIFSGKTCHEINETQSFSKKIYERQSIVELGQCLAPKRSDLYFSCELTSLYWNAINALLEA